MNYCDLIPKRVVFSYNYNNEEDEEEEGWGEKEEKEGLYALNMHLTVTQKKLFFYFSKILL